MQQDLFFLQYSWLTEKYVCIGRGYRRAKTPASRAQEVIREGKQGKDWDPQGMYTGVPAREGETPVQDADDL